MLGEENLKVLLVNLAKVNKLALNMYVLGPWSLPIDCMSNLQRQKTLFIEHQHKGHVGGILDRRFGENDPTMTPEERMLERFTRERQRSSKGMIYNLEEEDDLTHYGRSLSLMDDFDGAGLALKDDEEEEGNGIYHSK